MQNLLSQNILFVKEFEPYDFKNMGQLAVEVEYTDGSTDMLTTPTKNPNGTDKGDFKDEKEFYEFIEWLKQNNIKRRL